LIGAMSTASTIARELWGLLSFIALIAYLRWEGPLDDQREVTPPEVPNRQAENDDRDLSALHVPKATTATTMATGAPMRSRVVTPPDRPHSSSERTDGRA
jgi:hypothetical protein